MDERARADALETLERVGYVDDDRFAAGRAESLAGRGYGDEAIRYDLAGRGVDAETIDQALAGLDRKAVQKSGSYFSFGDERLGQGRQNATAFLKEHPDVVQGILHAIQSTAPPEQVISARLLPQANGAEAIIELETEDAAAPA